MSGFVVVVRSNGQAPVQLEFDSPKVVIGRETGDIILNDSMSSSTHAELQWSGGRLVFKDLNSTNGSFIEGQRVSQVELTAGMTVQIGNSSIQFTGVAGARGRTVVQPSNPPKRATAFEAPRQPASKGPKVVALVAAAGGLVVAGAVVAVLLMNGSKTSASHPAVSNDRPSKSLFGLGESKGGETVVKAVWFSGTPGVKVSGGTSDITLRVTPNATGTASVGISEEFAGGTGNQWRTATWLAAFNASRATGHSLIDHEYLVRAGGHIDGPSAGMLMTSTLMALLRGKPLLPNTTMTGTINPDGSAGPVGGIVQKLGGAKESGIKRFGYPMGARNHVDLSTMNTVDLNEVGAGLGLEVREIHDMYEAYEFMTGDTITRPTPADEATLELNADTSGRLRAKLTAWKSRLDGEVSGLKDQLRKNPAIGRQFNPQLVETEKAIAEATRYEKSDLPAAALRQFVLAELEASTIKDSIIFVERFGAGDFQGLLSQVEQSTAIAGQVKAFGDEIVIRSKRATVGGQVNATVAFTAYVTAQNFSDLGEEGRERAMQVIEGLKSGKIQRTTEAVTYAFENLAKPIIFYHGAEVMLNLARDFQDLTGEEGQASAANLSKLGREAGAYGSAAGASLAYFDALVTEEIDKQHMTKAEAQGVVAKKEMGYLLAHRGVQLTESLKSDADGFKNLLRLAAGIDAYLTSAALVNKYYSLNAEEKDGELIIHNRKSLTAQLEQARLHAREMAGLSMETVGFVPVGAKLDYQTAGALREGSDSDKLNALQSYWSSAFWSELAAKLGKKE